MDAIFINPFLDATIKVISTMAFTQPSAEKPFLRQPMSPLLGDVAGMMGLTGPIDGAVALSFPKAAILDVVSKMFQEQCVDLNSDVHDCAGELCNMVCGQARRTLAKEQGLSFRPSLPNVVPGEESSIRHQTQQVSVVILSSIPMVGQFFVDVSFAQPAHSG